MTQNDKDAKTDISAFLASAIHDMKNSLNPLVNFLEETLSELEPEARRKMAPMLYEARRVNDNLVQILAIYQLGKRFYPFDPTENSIESFVGEVVAQNQPLLSYIGIELESEYDPDLTWYFDRELVSGVISHALNNAARYARDKLKLIVRQVDDELEIRVEDNGPGYPDRMLEEGRTVGAGVDFSTGSTGLGIYFSSEVVKLHKNRGKTGSVLLENGGTYGGACFVLRIP